MSFSVRGGASKAFSVRLRGGATFLLKCAVRKKDPDSDLKSIYKPKEYKGKIIKEKNFIHSFF